MGGLDENNPDRDNLLFPASGGDFRVDGVEPGPPLEGDERGAVTPTKANEPSEGVYGSSCANPFPAELPVGDDD